MPLSSPYFSSPDERTRRHPKRPHQVKSKSASKARHERYSLDEDEHKERELLRRKGRLALQKKKVKRSLSESEKKRRAALLPECAPIENILQNSQLPEKDRRRHERDTRKMICTLRDSIRSMGLSSNSLSPKQSPRGNRKDVMKHQKFSNTQRYRTRAFFESSFSPMSAPSFAWDSQYSTTYKHSHSTPALNVPTQAKTPSPKTIRYSSATKHWDLPHATWARYELGMR